MSLIAGVEVGVVLRSRPPTSNRVSKSKQFAFVTSVIPIIKGYVFIALSAHNIVFQLSAVT